MAEEKKIFSYCMGCKGIKLREDMWIREDSLPDLYKGFKSKIDEGEILVSHGYCPDCGDKVGKDCD